MMYKCLIHWKLQLVVPACLLHQMLAPSVHYSKKKMLVHLMWSLSGPSFGLENNLESSTS